MNEDVRIKEANARAIYWHKNIQMKLNLVTIVGQLEGFKLYE